MRKSNRFMMNVIVLFLSIPIGAVRAIFDLLYDRGELYDRWFVRRQWTFTEWLADIRDHPRIDEFEEMACRLHGDSAFTATGRDHT